MAQKSLEEYLHLTSNMKSAWGGQTDDQLTLEDFVLTYGFRMGPKVDCSDRPRGVMKQCFRNAMMLMQVSPNLTYCEGYALSIIPVIHAWCCDKDGRVYDNTWSHKDGVEYIGVPFDNDFVLRWIEKNKVYASVIDDWKNHWPLLQSRGEPSFMHPDWRPKLVPSVKTPPPGPPSIDSETE